MKTKPRTLVGSIVQVPGERSGRLHVVLMVTKRDLKAGTNTWYEGLHAFSGMWYGTDPLRRKTFGKIHHLTGKEIILGHVSEYTPAQVKVIINSGKMPRTA